MKLYDLSQKLHEIRNRRLTAMLVLAAVVISGFSATSWAKALNIFTEAENVGVALAASVPAPDYSDRILYTASGAFGYDITLPENLAVTVRR
ncbi:MAG: hypothetical protein E7429_05395, partial [Ruminococcaceae bacterium]|nr:hypothetical protein [Oscillospiraceae bacterium]